MKNLNDFFNKAILIVGVLMIVAAIYNKCTWEDSIKNPANSAYVVEVAFNLDIEPCRVTQRQFNRRYKD